MTIFLAQTKMDHEDNKFEDDTPRKKQKPSTLGICNVCSKTSCPWLEIQEDFSPLIDYVFYWEKVLNEDLLHFVPRNLGAPVEEFIRRNIGPIYAKAERNNRKITHISASRRILYYIEEALGLESKGEKLSMCIYHNVNNIIISMGRDEMVRGYVHKF